MNIIALLESVSIDKSKIGSFSKEEYTQIKKELVAQQQINPEIQDADIANLLKALKTHADAFLVVLNNRVLVNFFTQKDYARQHFSNEFAPVEIEKVKTFISLFLAGDLKAFFTAKIEEDKFDEMSQLSEASEYFPDNLNTILRQHSLKKLDDAITALKPPYGNLSKILYIKKPQFFTFLNHIKDEEIEQSVKELLESVTGFYRMDYSSELANQTFSAMNSYNAFDPDFSQKIKSNKDISDSNFGTHIRKKRNLTWVYVAVGIFVLIRIVMFISVSRFNNNDDVNNDVSYEEEIEYEEPPRQIDKYYTNMKFNIDSFQVFLAGYNESEIKQMTQDVSLKTGDNPFETIYENPPAGESTNFIKVRNNTPYDMVLLENTVLYDSIKIPLSAHFIKKGENLEINFNRADTKTVFNVYLGKKWATFQTDSNHLFIRNGSIVEYRFSELIPNAKEILKTDYAFPNDATISYSKGGLDIDSKDAMVNPLSENRE